MHLERFIWNTLHPSVRVRAGLWLDSAVISDIRQTADRRVGYMTGKASISNGLSIDCRSKTPRATVNAVSHIPNVRHLEKVGVLEVVQKPLGLAPAIIS